MWQKQPYFDDMRPHCGVGLEGIFYMTLQLLSKYRHSKLGYQRFDGLENSSWTRKHWHGEHLLNLNFRHS